MANRECQAYLSFGKYIYLIDSDLIGRYFMAHHAVENNPAKEACTALIGIVLLLAIIIGIGLAGWLRPAGDHQPPSDLQPIDKTVASQTIAESVSETAALAAANTDNAVAAANVEAAAQDTLNDPTNNVDNAATDVATQTADTTKP